MNDIDAWLKFPQLRHWYNKLWLSEQLRYTCGPGGVPVPYHGVWIHRPIINLEGMGLGTKFDVISPKEKGIVPPGSFWCEVFEGVHRTIDYRWSPSGRWVQENCFVGWKTSGGQFYKWTRDKFEFTLPHFFWELSPCKKINVELIGDKIIEVHQRGNPDPVEYDEFIPVWGEVLQWKDKYSDHTYVESFEDCEGQLSPPRLGFFCK